MTVVLLTGASGMLGQAVLRSATNQAVDWQLLTPSRAELDLRDRVAVAGYFDRYSIDAVVHCAAKVGGIQANMADPSGFYLDNLLINTHVIEEARLHGVQRLVCMGSSCMYPKDMGHPLGEHDLLSAPLEPTNEGYALAKLGAARQCAYSRQQYGLFYSMFIPCNMYGPGDCYDPARSHFIPAIIAKLHEAKQRGNQIVEIWGAGDAKRECVYVDDVADFMVLSLDKLDRYPDCLNVGSGQDRTVLEYYEAAAQVVGYGGDFSHRLDAPVGMKQKLMSSARARSFGWSPLISLEEGLRLAYHDYLDQG